MTSREFLLGCSFGIVFVLINSQLYDWLYFQCKRVPNERHFPFGESEPTLPQVVYNRSLGPVLANDLDTIYNQRGNIVAQQLARNVRILCWVLTKTETLYKKGKAVKETWGKRCNILVFMSSVEDKAFPAVGLNVSEGREHLWLKTRAAWKYVHDHHLDDADWFMKVDDDAFVIVENLRYFVAHYDTSNPYYFLSDFVQPGGKNSEGAGYVFSKATMRAFVRVTKDPKRCKLKTLEEDVDVVACLASEGVSPSGSRDKLGKETFHPYSPQTQLIPTSKQNREKKTGHNCCSALSITFHDVEPDEMYILDYFIYRLHAYGVTHIHENI